MTIFASIARGDEEQVRQWIRGGASLADGPDEAAREELAASGVEEDAAALPPLHLAASLGHAAVVEALLDAGAEIDRPVFDDLDGELTPLGCAASRGHRETVQVLLAAGASARKAATALFVTESLEILETLIAAGADLEAIPYEDGSTLLMSAAASDDVERVRFLLAAGADPHTRDGYDGGFALSYAAVEGAEAAYGELLPHYSEEEVAEAGERAGIARRDRERRVADRSGRGAIVGALAKEAAALQLGCDPEDLRDGAPDLAAILASDGLPAERPLEDEPTPLMVAARQGLLDRVETLLAAGASVATVARTGGPNPGTVLAHALEPVDGDVRRRMVERLLAAGADVDQRGSCGRTALMFAAVLESWNPTGGEVAPGLRALLAAGPDLELRDDFGKTVWLVAHEALADQQRRRRALEQTLAGKGVDPRHFADELEQAGNAERIARLLEAAGAKPRSLDDHRLVASAKDGDLDAARRALAAGASPDARSFDGTSALLLAVERRHQELVALLIEHGCDVDAQALASGYVEVGPGQMDMSLTVTGPGMRPATRPLIEAVRRLDSGLVRRLVAAGADPELGTEEDPEETPLAISRSAGYGSVEIRDCLASLAPSRASRPGD